MRSEMIVDLPSDLECPICLDTLLNPVAEFGTQHIFCYKCVKGLLQCPLCRKGNFATNPVEIKLLKQLQFICCDCHKAHPYNQFENHYKNCKEYYKYIYEQFTQIVKCMKSICIKNFDNHLKECHLIIFDHYVQGWNYLLTNPREWQWWWWSKNPWWENKGCQDCQLMYNIQTKILDGLDQQRLNLLNELLQMDV